MHDSSPSLELITQQVGECLKQNQPMSALRMVQQALLKQPQDCALLELKTRIHIELHHWRPALAYLQVLTQQFPKQLDLWLNQGIAQQQLAQIPTAKVSLQQALTLDPQRVEPYLALSALLLEQDENQAALQLCLQALQRQLQHPFLVLNYSTALLAEQQYADVLTLLEHYEQPLSLEMRVNRTQAYLGLQQWDKALADILDLIRDGSETAQQSSPLLMEELLQQINYSTFADALQKIDRTPLEHFKLLEICNSYLYRHPQRWTELWEVNQALLSAASTDQQRARALMNLGSVLAWRKRFAEARQLFQRAYALNSAIVPPEPVQEYARIHIDALRVCNWEKYQDFHQEYLPLVQSQISVGKAIPGDPFNSLYLDIPQWLELATARQQAQQASQLADTISVSRPSNAGINSQLPTRRLRIGYVSGDFRNHATSHLIQHLFTHHDRQRFEIFAFSLYKDLPDDIYQQRIIRDCDHYITLHGHDDAAAAQLIADAQIDILIDLMGYTQHCRSVLFALRLAPLQMLYLGMPGTSGADYMDYVIADPVVLPEQLRPYFSEQVLYLPDTYMVTARQAIAHVPARKQFGLPENDFVFCSFNNPIKLEPKLFNCWMGILKQIPNSVLWLLINDDTTKANLLKQADNAGINAQRLVFASYLPKAQHLGRLRHADLFLDSFIYNAHTTSVDALWSGIPILTLEGIGFPARVGSSHLQALGMPELITHSVEEYQQRAIYLAQHPDELQALRAKVAQLRLTSPLFDTELFARHLERGFEMAWERHQQGLAPTVLQVPSLR